MSRRGTFGPSFGHGPLVRAGAVPGASLRKVLRTQRCVSVTEWWTLAGREASRSVTVRFIRFRLPVIQGQASGSMPGEWGDVTGAFRA